MQDEPALGVPACGRTSRENPWSSHGRVCHAGTPPKGCSSAGQSAGLQNRMPQVRLLPPLLLITVRAANRSHRPGLRRATSSGQGRRAPACSESSVLRSGDRFRAPAAGWRPHSLDVLRVVEDEQPVVVRRSGAQCHQYGGHGDIGGGGAQAGLGGRDDAVRTTRQPFGDVCSWVLCPDGRPAPRMYVSLFSPAGTACRAVPSSAHLRIHSSRVPTPSVRVRSGLRRCSAASGARVREGGSARRADSIQAEASRSAARLVGVVLWWGPVLPCSVTASCRGSQDLPALWRGRFAVRCRTRAITSRTARCGS